MITVKRSVEIALTQEQFDKWPVSKRHAYLKQHPNSKFADKGKLHFQNTLHKKPKQDEAQKLLEFRKQDLKAKIERHETRLQQLKDRLALVKKENPQHAPMYENSIKVLETNLQKAKQRLADLR